MQQEYNSRPRPLFSGPGSGSGSGWGSTLNSTSNPTSTSTLINPRPSLIPLGARNSSGRSGHRNNLGTGSGSGVQTTLGRSERIGAPRDDDHDPTLEAIRRESIQIEQERQARMQARDEALLRTLAESQRADRERVAERARVQLDEDRFLQQALVESQRARSNGRETEEETKEREELEMVMALSLSEHDFATTSSQRFAQLSFNPSPQHHFEIDEDEGTHSISGDSIQEHGNQARMDTNISAPDDTVGRIRRRTSLYTSFVVTNPDDDSELSPPPPAYDDDHSQSTSSPIAPQSRSNARRSTPPLPPAVPSTEPPPHVSATAFYSGAIAAAMSSTLFPPPLNSKSAYIQPLSASPGTTSPYLHRSSSSYTSLSERSDGQNSVRMSVLSTTSMAGSFAEDLQEEVMGRLYPRQIPSSSSLVQDEAKQENVPTAAAASMVQDDYDPFDDRFATEINDDDNDAQDDKSSTETVYTTEGQSKSPSRDLFGITREIPREATQRPPLSIIAPSETSPTVRSPISNYSSRSDPASAITPTNESTDAFESRFPELITKESEEFQAPPNRPVGSLTSLDSTSMSNEALAAYRVSPSSGGMVIDGTSGGAALVTEDIIEGVTWGFVPFERVASHPPLDREGPFQKAAQLSRYLNEETNKRPFQCFAIEAPSWHRLLCYLMWFGYSQIEAAPFDHGALVKQQNHFSVRVWLQFFRSFVDRTPRVRCLIEMVSLADGAVEASNRKQIPPSSSTSSLLSTSSTAQTISSTVTFDASCPNITLPLDFDSSNPLILPLSLAHLGTTMSKAHTSSSNLNRHTGSSSTYSNKGSTIIEKNLSSAVLFFKQLNGEFSVDAGQTDAEDFERSTLERLKVRLQRVRGKRVGIEGGRMEGTGGSIPEEATLITPFILEDRG